MVVCTATSRSTNILSADVQMLRVQHLTARRRCLHEAQPPFLRCWFSTWYSKYLFDEQTLKHEVNDQSPSVFMFVGSPLILSNFSLEALSLACAIESSKQSLDSSSDSLTFLRTSTCTSCSQIYKEVTDGKLVRAARHQNNFIPVFV